MGPNLGPERGVSHLGALEQWPTEGMPPCPHRRLAMARLSRGGPLAFTSRCYGAWGVGRGIKGKPGRLHVLTDGLLNPVKAPLQNHKERACKREGFQLHEKT